jgi:hypothetical protein
MRAMTDSGDRHSFDNSTTELNTRRGNKLFERAVAALGHDKTAMRWMMVSALQTIGSTPAAMTPEELGVLLPEISRRLRQLLLSDQAEEAQARLSSALMKWAEEN